MDAGSNGKTNAMVGKKGLAPKPFASKTLVVAKKKPAVAKKTLVVAKKKPAVAMKKPAVATKPLFAVSKPKATQKFVVAKKPLAKKAVKPTATMKAVAKKPTVATKKIVAKKPMMATKVVAKKPLVAAKKPMMMSKPKMAVRSSKSASKSMNTTMTLKETADLGFAGIIAGSFLLSLAILPGIADVALETVGIAYTLYFTYNFLLFEESREDFKKSLADLESSTGIDIPAIFDSTIGAVSALTDKMASSSSASYPKKADEPMMATKETN